MNTKSHIVISLLISLIVSMLASIGVIAYVNRIHPQIGTVDILSSMETQKQRFMTVITDPNASPERKQAALVEGQRFAERINTALAQIAKECNCTLVVKQAIANGFADDYTALLLSKLGTTQ